MVTAESSGAASRPRAFIVRLNTATIASFELRRGALNSGHALPIDDPRSPLCLATTCSRPSPRTSAPVHRDGHKFVAIALALALSVLPAVAAARLVRRDRDRVYIAYFFRDPDRVTPLREGWSSPPPRPRLRHRERTPAGRAGPRRHERVRISIFLSVLNVHINRAPWRARSSARSTCRVASSTPPSTRRARRTSGARW